MKRIILTGGGTAGHVTPNLALLPTLRKAGFDIRYIGSYEGIEKELARQAGIPYDGISSGKLRRYFDMKNLTDPFRVVKGFFEADALLKKHKPDVIFSKGGFVSVPVVMAARKRNIPAVLHESDITPGLANKLCLPAASFICCNFPETVSCLPKEKTVLTGCPIRDELLTGERLTGLKMTGFSASKPVLLVIGGSSGSVKVNEAVRSILPALLDSFQVIHLCGKGNLDHTLDHLANYVQYEYMNEPLRHLFAAADLVISRAGANAICELLALRKPALLIPLSTAASRGDQILNAHSFQKQGFSAVLEEEEMTSERLYQEVKDLYKNRSRYIHAMKNSQLSDAAGQITALLKRLAGILNVP